MLPQSLSLADVALREVLDRRGLAVLLIKDECADVLDQLGRQLDGLGQCSGRLGAAGRAWLLLRLARLVRIQIQRLLILLALVRAHAFRVVVRVEHDQDVRLVVCLVGQDVAVWLVAIDHQRGSQLAVDLQRLHGRLDALDALAIDDARGGGCDLLQFEADFGDHGVLVFLAQLVEGHFTLAHQAENDFGAVVVHQFGGDLHRGHVVFLGLGYYCSLGASHCAHGVSLWSLVWLGVRRPCRGRSIHAGQFAR
ncbi:hypothetical protein D3C85_802230 [compost metagenome]